MTIAAKQRSDATQHDLFATSPAPAGGRLKKCMAGYWN